MSDCTSEVDTYADTSNSLNKKCIKCSSIILNCYKCSDATHCLSCLNNKFLKFD